MNEMPNTLRVQRVHEAAQLPQYQSAGAACFDLHCINELPEPAWETLGMYGSVVIQPGCAHTFRTGLKVEVPAGYVMKIYSRSGHGFKSGVRLSNGTGIIDSDYRGELYVRLQNDGHEEFRVNHTDRIAQALLEPAPQWRIEAVDKLSVTERGERGLGSTGS